MAGLLANGPAPEDNTAAPGAPPAAAPGDEQEPADTVDDNEGTEEATPEEQAQYDTFVKLGRKLIADQGDKIMDLLDEDPADLIKILGEIKELREPTPAMTLAATAVIVVLETVKQSPEKPDDVIIFHGGKELLETLAQLGTDGGGHDYTQDEMNQAWLHAQDLYREAGTAEGLVDQDALKQQFDELVTADKQGQLGKVLPQLANAKVEGAPDQPAEGGEDNVGTA